MIINKKTSVVAQNSFVGTTPFHIAIDYTVSEIEKNAFQHCYSLRIITIPPNVRYLRQTKLSFKAMIALKMILQILYPMMN